MIYTIVIIILFLLPSPTEHRITYYSAGDGCGFVCADGTRIVDPAQQRIAALSPAAERLYGMGAVLWVEGEGLYIVRDRTARFLDSRWPEGTVDICVVPGEGRGRKWKKVWLITKFK